MAGVNLLPRVRRAAGGHRFGGKSGSSDWLAGRMARRADLVCCIGNRVAIAGTSGERASGGVDFAQDIFALSLPDVPLRIVIAGGQEGDDRIGQFARRGKAPLADKRGQVAEEPLHQVHP